MTRTARNKIAREGMTSTEEDRTTREGMADRGI